MPNSRPFPSKEADLNVYFHTAIPYLVSEAERLMVSETNKTTVTEQFTIWNDGYLASQNSNTRTKTTLVRKDIAKDNLINCLRSIYADIPASVFTVEDRNTLNLPQRSTTRTPTPVPSTKPIVQVNTSHRLKHTISFTNLDGGLAKPTGVRGCQIWFKIGEPAIDPSELKFMTTDTATPYTFTFNGENAGKSVYYWLRWENTRGETGPWSDVVVATITG